VSASGDARALHHAVHAVVCDVLEPWEFGTIAKATRYPSYFDFNVVRVERDPGMTVEELIAFADEALAGLPHRRIDIEDSAAGDPLRAGFERCGWEHERLVWMRHEGARPPVPGALDIEEVPYDAVKALRLALGKEDFPTVDLQDHLSEAQKVAHLLRAQVFAVLEAGEPVGYAQLQRIGPAAEVAQVYVSAGHRGRGLGTALTCAAMDAARDVDELWIVGDDEGRPKHLYARLGFRPAWTVELLRLPAVGPSGA
jgi:GNAT superfamily N-acetyltransferase